MIRDFVVYKDGKSLSERKQKIWIHLKLAYVSGHENTPIEAQNRAKKLCWEYNRTAPDEQDKPEWNQHKAESVLFDLPPFIDTIRLSKKEAVSHEYR